MLSLRLVREINEKGLLLSIDRVCASLDYSMTKKIIKNPYRTIILAVPFVILFFIVVFIIRFTFGLWGYPVFWVICGGHKPIIGTSYVSRSYDMPGSELYHPLNIFNSAFFCSEYDAQSAGFQGTPDAEIKYKIPPSK